jgi:hypothetical protein
LTKEIALRGSIVLQFAGSNDVESDLIKIFSRGWCSHVDAVMADGTLLGARLSGGVAIRPASYASWPRVQRVHLDTTPEIADAFYAALVSQVGKPYDVTAIAAFALGRSWQSPDKWFCSELQAWALTNAGFFRHPLAATDSTITPRDLLLVVSAFSPDATAAAA